MTGPFKLKFFRKKARREALNKFINRYQEILDIYGDCEKKCLIAHSFGTYITGTALQENSQFICDKIIFAGNILDIEYNWNKLKENNQIQEVLIEQSTNDLAVLAAQLLRQIFKQKWIGYAGRAGFKNQYPYLTTIKSKTGHSDMLNKENMSSIWFDFLIK